MRGSTGLAPLSLAFTAACAVCAMAQQWPLNIASHDSSSYEFEHKIERVAVIGAGATGLQHAAALLEHGFEVRLFERAPRPGGQWLYTDKTPVPASFPNRPLETLGYIPDIPDEPLPLTRYYAEGDEGLSVDWRIREHWNPASIWAGLKTTVPFGWLSLPNIKYPPDIPWKMNNRFVQRHVRQYASSVGLNSNDEEHGNVTSYSTRVEHIHKAPGAQQWTLTLRKIAPELEADGRVRVDWWTEKFDAVVAATAAENDAPWTPPIPGLQEWAKAFPKEIDHGRSYRRPLEGKNVLIVGGSLSGAGIAADLAPLAASVTMSIRQNRSDENIVLVAASYLIPDNTTFVPEIESFSEFSRSDSNSPRHASIRLINGTAISGFDHIIFATGYRKSFPFLADFINSTIAGYDEPEVEVAPILTDGTHLRSLYWTGNYIPDPTLAVANVEPWDVGRFQSLGLAKIWSGKARLPSTAAMWNAYPGAKQDSFFPILRSQYSRLYATWLNDAALEFGGRLIAPLQEDLIALGYFHAKTYGIDFGLHAVYEELGNMPRSQWPTWNGTHSFKTSRNMEDPHWADLNGNW